MGAAKRYPPTQSQVLKSKLKHIIVAVDHQLVEKKLNELNIPNIMTSNKLNSGTERVAEIASKIDGKVFINIQADEPFIDPDIINLLMNLFNDIKSIKMGTIASTQLSKNDFYDNSHNTPQGSIKIGHYLYEKTKDLF